MDKYLVDLIERISDKNVQHTAQSSSQTISWKVMQEAEKINDKRYIKLLISFIGNFK